MTDLRRLARYLGPYKKDMVIGALLVMGTSSIRNFVFPIMIGLIAGTYSSIFVSGSIWHDISGMFEKKKYRGK